jgi:hypothetical protein
VAPAAEEAGAEVTRPFLTFFMVILVGAVVVSAGLVVIELAWSGVVLKHLSN